MFLVGTDFDGIVMKTSISLVLLWIGITSPSGSGSSVRGKRQKVMSLCWVCVNLPFHPVGLECRTVSLFAIIEIPESKFGSEDFGKL